MTRNNQTNAPTMAPVMNATDASGGDVPPTLVPTMTRNNQTDAPTMAPVINATVLNETETAI